MYQARSMQIALSTTSNSISNLRQYWMHLHIYAYQEQSVPALPLQIIQLYFPTFISYIQWQQRVYTATTKWMHSTVLHFHNNKIPNLFWIQMKHRPLLIHCASLCYISITLTLYFKQDNGSFSPIKLEFEDSVQVVALPKVSQIF